jgi:Na+/proline symporter
MLCILAFVRCQQRHTKHADSADMQAFGGIFTLLTSVMVYADYRFGGTSYTSEQFSTAGRSIKAGLTACDIVSKWTWAATLLQSANVAYK